MLIVYWTFGGIYTFLDVTNKPAALRRYKVQPGTNEPVDSARLIQVRKRKCVTNKTVITFLNNNCFIQVIICVIFNQIVVGLPTAYLMSKLMIWRGTPPFRELPTFHWVLAEMAFHILMEEVGFYYSHR